MTAADDRLATPRPAGFTEPGQVDAIEVQGVTYRFGSHVAVSDPGLERARR
jgi:hypothetical protein